MKILGNAMRRVAFGWILVLFMLCVGCPKLDKESLEHWENDDHKESISFDGVRDRINEYSEITQQIQQLQSQKHDIEREIEEMKRDWREADRGVQFVQMDLESQKREALFHIERAKIEIEKSNIDKDAARSTIEFLGNSSRVKKQKNALIEQISGYDEEIQKDEKFIAEMNQHITNVQNQQEKNKNSYNQLGTEVRSEIDKRYYNISIIDGAINAKKQRLSELESMGVYQ